MKRFTTLTICLFKILTWLTMGTSSSFAAVSVGFSDGVLTIQSTDGSAVAISCRKAGLYVTADPFTSTDRPSCSAVRSIVLSGDDSSNRFYVRSGSTSKRSVLRFAKLDSISATLGDGNDRLLLGIPHAANVEVDLDGGAGTDSFRIVVTSSRTARGSRIPVSLIALDRNTLTLKAFPHSMHIDLNDFESASYAGSYGKDIVNLSVLDPSIVLRLSGLSGDDDLTGSEGDDVIFGGFGDDTLSGNGGADVLSGDFGNDIIRGGAGDDRLHGGKSNDSLFGEEGEDLLGGSDGNDFLSGGADRDALYGGQGGDLIHGDQGNDILRGGAGFDRIHGDDGNDSLIGHSGRDVLKGGLGIDSCSNGNSTQDCEN